MFIKSFIFSVTLLLILSSSLLADDLYLLDIKSYDELAVAESIISEAHGRIDGRFIVNLDKDQLKAADEAGLDIELLAADADLSRLYNVVSVRPELAKTALYFEPLLSSGSSYLTELSESSIDIVRREGYMVIGLEDLVTPLFYQPENLLPLLPLDYPSDSLADLISEDSLYHFDTRLEDFQSRYIYSDSIHSARDWLVSQFQSYGYTDVETDYFNWNGLGCYNVLCYKPGTTEADKLIVIGAHYDSINFDQPQNGINYAPGADDNASGTSMVLELARILKDVDTKKSILFCAFSAEEVGLVGSYYVAQDLYYNSPYEVEVMFNFDMVAYDASSFEKVYVYSGDGLGYSNAFHAAAYRVSTLTAPIRVEYGNSDHASFEQFGFNIASVAEYEFNTLGWHTDLDISSRLDFPYLAEIGKISAATIGHVDNAAAITPIESVRDIGDGQSIRIEWGNCNPEYTYYVVYGTSSYPLNDTVYVGSVPPCYVDITGLTEGQTYYMSAFGVNADGYGPIQTYIVTGASYVIPRPPTGVEAEPDYQQINITWNSNLELDLNHYKLLRREAGGDWTELESSLTDTTYSDITAEGHTTYEYMVIAVDNDAYESDSSLFSGAVAATFDWPLLFVEETSSSGAINPSETDQDLFYDSLLFKDVLYGKYQIDVGEDKVSRSMSGQYGSIIWIDDDLATHHFESSSDSLEWYLEYNTNLCLAGWQTFYWMTGDDPLTAGDFLYDQFGITQVTENASFDFIGAYGENGWPDVTVDTDNIFSGMLPNISKLSALPGAQVIYRYKSLSGDSQFENYPCGVLYDTGNGINIALAFPIYHLTDSSAVALVNKIFATFGIEEYIINGDVNSDDKVNLLDIIYVINYLYTGGPAPINPNQADVNGDCVINLVDITTMINYLYQGGPQLEAGCVE